MLVLNLHIHAKGANSTSEDKDLEIKLLYHSMKQKKNKIYALNTKLHKEMTTPNRRIKGQ